ncbi:uncharacterized protein KY384_007147 [Bacidia gigantensis]|uniref:uncharacterized protein n=1 Tax=Bacidia gigantensis TaxID=2732470 RepID=UPI001D05AB4E|nr:uncharacterized protein KY384_007147 [Bacidia gigantensis]KAG8528230.1 hypothetical protein KY384_007147 [Bacidia gigantensis]
MHFRYCFAALFLGSSLASAIPAPDNAVKRDPSLRLIKTSPSDPGTWVTEEDKISKYRAKNVNFIDVTDIKDPVTLKLLSGSGADNARAAAVVYPTTISHQTQANGFIASANTTGPKSWLKTLSDFFNRYYKSSYGTQSATWLFNTVKSVASANPAITVSQFTHSYAQPSIIARLPGTSSNLVIVGAHFDSTGGSSTARGPGADDNGSGVVVILEAMRVLANAKFAPKDTLEFHFYSGEEGGLLGSADVWRSYKSQAKPVLAFVNTDMAGYSPSGKISVYNDYADTGLTAYVRRIVSGYIGTSTQDTCGYGCSDHASAYSNGFPAAYVCDEPDATSDPYIHSPRDVSAALSEANMHGKKADEGTDL